MYQPRPSIVQLEEIAHAARLGVSLALEDRAALAELAGPSAFTQSLALVPTTTGRMADP
jgi:hypothetical protein